MNIIDGDIIQIREERYEADGVVVGVERGTDFDGSEVTFVLADFGGPQVGRIPLRGGVLPKDFHLVKVA